MKTPESRSGLRMARFWNTKASISIPVPATAQAISDPRMPVATPKRAGSEKTPAPTMPPTTIPVSVGRLIFSGVTTDVSATASATRRGGGIVSTIVRYSRPGGGSSATARQRGRSLGQELEDQPGDPADQDGHGDGGEEDAGEAVQQLRRRRLRAPLHMAREVEGDPGDRGVGQARRGQQHDLDRALRLGSEGDEEREGRAANGQREGDRHECEPWSGQPVS